MTEAVIVALIALAGQIIIAIVANSGIVAKLDKQSEVSDTKLRGEMNVMEGEISTLRREVQKHNNLVERTFKLEERVSVHEEKIEVANRRIADLENNRSA